MIAIIFFVLIIECYCLDSLNLGASKFGIELVRSTDSDNVVIAPFLIWNLLASLSFWAKGDFKEQMLDVLRLPKNKTIFLSEYANIDKTLFATTSNRINISSKIFIYVSTKCELYPEFKETMKTHFEALIETMDFENGKDLANRADNLIFEHVDTAFKIFQPQDFVDTSLIISSVVTFDFKFKSRFSSFNTIPRITYKNNVSNRVLIMQQTLKLPYSNMSILNSDVMELALGDDGKFCLLLIVPNSQTNMKEVYKKLNAVTIKDIFDKLQSDVEKFGMKEINLKLPKTRIETAIVLNKPLSDIGLKHILGPEKSEFTGIAKDDLYISTIDHTCEVIIAENGVYAMASTPGYLNYNRLNLTFEAEQPFIFFVMEKSTQTMLLGGLYSKPRNMVN